MAEQPGQAGPVAGRDQDDIGTQPPTVDENDIAPIDSSATGG